MPAMTLNLQEKHEHEGVLGIALRRKFYFAFTYNADSKVEAKPGPHRSPTVGDAHCRRTLIN